jgi:two-component sensor histidine kinase
LDQGFGFAVQVAGGFVEHKNPGVFQDDARQGNALFLAAAQTVTALAHDRVVAIAQVHDEVVDVAARRRIDLLRVASILRTALTGAIESEQVGFRSIRWPSKASPASHRADRARRCE